MGLAPGLSRIAHYERGWLRGDVVAGVTVAAYLVPQVMAYAEVAGLPSVAGLWATAAAMVVYVVLGSSPHLSVGPESTTALMTATVVGPLAAGDPARYAALAAALGLIVAAICLVAWAARLGFLANLLSKPVLVGYLAGVAVIMIAAQLDSFTGVAAEHDRPLGQIAEFVEHIGDVHGPTLAMGATVLVFLFVAGHRFPRLPVPLFGILAAAAAVALFDLGQDGLHLVGSVPAGLPSPRVPDVGWGDLADMAGPALGVAMVGFTDNALDARAFADRGGYRIDANQELLALSGANVASGFFQGFPVSSSGSRTVIGFSLGARSQAYSLVAAALVVVVLLLLAPVLESFPQAALAAVVIWAAVKLVDLRGLQRIWRFRRSEFVLAIATTVAVLLADILYGVLIAVGLSVLDLIVRVARPHDGVLGYVPGLAGMHDIDDYPDARQVPGLVVYRYDAPLFFANAANFRTRALASLDEAEGPVEWMVLNFEANVHIDLTAVDALDQLYTDLRERGIVLALARVKFEMHEELRHDGFIDRIGADRVFATLPTAVVAFVDWYTDRHGHPPPGFVAPRPPESPEFGP